MHASKMVKSMRKSVPLFISSHSLPSPHYSFSSVTNRQANCQTHRIVSQKVQVGARSITNSHGSNGTRLSDMRNTRVLVNNAWAEAICATKSRTAIDATAGRGSDSISLGQLVGDDGVVHAFDIQQTAMDETVRRYEQRESDHGGMGVLHAYVRSHEDFDSLGLRAGSVCCCAYNLGWYPGRGADRSVITTVDTTLASLNSAQSLIAVGGVITVMAYVGHEGGREEELACFQWAQNLSNREWSSFVLRYPNRNAAPSVLICQRISSL